MDYGILTLLPPALAIVLAFWTRNVLLSLFIAVLVGAVMLAGGDPVAGFVSALSDYLFAKLGDPYNASIVLLMLLVGVFATLLERGGGAIAMLRTVRDRVSTSRQGQLTTWLGGMVIWFSDSSNAVVLGPIVRPVTDRVRISREKLAYLLDATSATVPSLLPITAWGAFIIGIIVESLPEGVSGMSTFIASIPYHLYTIGVILIVLVVALTGWDYGPMRAAEQRARTTGKLTRTAEAAAAPEDRAQLPEGAHPTLWGMVLPVLALIGTLFFLLWYTGSREENLGLIDAVLGGSTMVGLVGGFLVACIVATVYAVRAGSIPRRKVAQTWLDGCRSMVEVILILVLAWSIGGITSDIGAPDYIVGLTGADLSPAVVFLVIFLVAGTIAFATGSSWGTFAIVLPIAIPVALATDVALAPAIGAAVAGGVFGDHCSPISDTTILASFGAGCDHLDHVRTQLPYALTVASAAGVGYVVAGLTANAVLALGTTLAVAVLLTYVLSRWDRSRHPDQVRHDADLVSDAA